MVVGSVKEQTQRLAARLACCKGVEYLESMPMTVIAGLGVRYRRSELERTHLLDEIATSNLPDRQRIAELLGEAGVLTTLERGPTPSPSGRGRG